MKGLDLRGGPYAPGLQGLRRKSPGERMRVKRGAHRLPSPISAGRKRSTFLGLPEKLLGTGRPPGESATRKRLIDFPRVERSTRDVKVQRPQEPQADQTTATAVCQAPHRRRCVAQSPWLNHPRDTINRLTWPSHVLRFSGQKLRSLLPDCCRISLRGNRRSLSGVSHDPERSDSLL